MNIQRIISILKNALPIAFNIVVILGLLLFLLLSDAFAFDQSNYLNKYFYFVALFWTLIFCLGYWNFRANLKKIFILTVMNFLLVFAFCLVKNETEKYIHNKSNFQADSGDLRNNYFLNKNELNHLAKTYTNENFIGERCGEESFTAVNVICVYKVDSNLNIQFIVSRFLNGSLGYIYVPNEVTPDGYKYIELIDEHWFIYRDS